MLYIEFSKRINAQSPISFEIIDKANWKFYSKIEEALNIYLKDLARTTKSLIPLSFILNLR